MIHRTQLLTSGDGYRRSSEYRSPGLGLIHTVHHRARSHEVSFEPTVGPGHPASSAIVVLRGRCVVHQRGGTLAELVRGDAHIYPGEGSGGVLPVSNDLETLKVLWWTPSGRFLEDGVRRLGELFALRLHRALLAVNDRGARIAIRRVVELFQVALQVGATRLVVGFSDPALEVSFADLPRPTEAMRALGTAVSSVTDEVRLPPNRSQFRNPVTLPASLAQSS